MSNVSKIKFIIFTVIMKLETWISQNNYDMLVCSLETELLIRADPSDPPRETVQQQLRRHHPWLTNHNEPYLC